MMTACIYLFRSRIIHWSPLSTYSKPAEINGLMWVITSGPYPMTLDEMVKRGDIGYNAAKGFVELKEPIPSDWDKRISYIRKIDIVAKLDTVKNSRKSHYTDHSVGQALAEFLLIDEVRNFQKNDSLDGCFILQALLETNEKENTAEGLVAKLDLQYESYRMLIAALIHLEYKVRAALENDELDLAEHLVNAEIEKMN